jgi:hypothetical protein
MTSHKVATNYIPFFLTYRQEAILPVELEIPTLRTALWYEIGDVGATTQRLFMLESLDESRRNVLHNFEIVQMKRKAYYDKIHTKTTTFSSRDLVLCIDSWLIK